MGDGAIDRLPGTTSDNGTSGSGTSPESTRLPRRAVLGATVTCAVGGALMGWPHQVRAQDSPISIDRTLDDLVVLQAAPDATVSGTARLDQGTDFVVRVFSQEAPAFDVQAGTVVTDAGTWSATVDLSDAEDGQSATIEVIFNGDVVASAPVVIGPLSARVRFDDQNLLPGERTIRITRIRLEMGGFVVVRDAVDGSLRGVSEYLAAGRTHEEVPVQLNDPVSGVENLVATAWLDANGDRLFGIGIDRPYPDGDPRRDTATISARPPPTETPSPPPQSAKGLDVAVGVTGGILGTLGLRRVAGFIAREIRKRRRKNTPPIPKPIAVPETARAGVPVLFDGTLSFDPDPDDGVEEYEWSIGETTADGPRHVHVFGEAGEYDIDFRVEDGNGSVGHTTMTLTVEETGTLEVAAVNPDAEGNDWEQLHRELIVFENTGEAALDVSGWSVYDAAEAAGRVSPGSHAFTFPDEFELDGGATVALHTGAEPESDRTEVVSADEHLYWGSPAPIWNNQTDRIVVEDADDNPVLGARYERTDTGEYSIETIEQAKLEDWFGSVTLEETIHVPILGITIGPTIGSKAIKTAIDFGAACLYLRGSAAFMKAWALLATFLAVSIVTWLISVGSGILIPSISIDGPLTLLAGAVVMISVGSIAWLFAGLRRKIANLGVE